ncbi:MAG: tRNA lysidine(34) synthetase TilS [Propionibacteriaceae bacterium]|jgi:tRNA(Ile)-lysidine synthase|nr:tRNA lysidine(34) synthetase TilS [Propionibacteriaceae bacterium]
MARRALSSACLEIVQNLERVVGGSLIPDSLTGGHTLTVAFSGGADSTALAAAVAWATTRRRGPLQGIPAAAHVIDHGLQVDSAAVAARAVAQAEELGLPARVTRVEVDAADGGIEAAARHARYAALLADPDALVLTGHTLDDQAETVLLGLARGSGTRSLGGMRAQRGRVMRPLLAIRRETIRQACRDWGLTWWEDPMNADPRFTRVRARAALATLEETLGPGLTESLARSAALCADDADALDALAAASATTTVADLAALPAALRRRVLRDWLARCGASELTAHHLRAVESLVTTWHGQAGVDLPGGRVRRTDGELRFVAAG